MVYTLRFFSLQNAVCFINLTYLVLVLFIFYIQGVLKLKKNNSGAKRLIVECATCIVSNVAVHLYPEADNSINLLFLCIACMNCFDTVKCLMEAYIHASANKVRGKIIQKNLTN